MPIDRTVRLSQTLAPFGVGAIYDFVGESLVGCDTALWKGHGTPLRLRRLEDELGVSGFRAAPSHVSLFGATGPRVPYARFPQWLFCPRCRRMAYWARRDEQPGEAPRCRLANCSGSAQLVPMRFISVCEDGHMGEVPWQLWAHIGASDPEQKQCRSRDLSFVSRSGAGTGLASLAIRCNTCKASNNLARLSSADSLQPYNIRCSGSQPWQRDEAAESCQRTPQVVQRGATNVYFAQISSALDIPPDSNYSSYADVIIDIVNTAEFQALASNPDSAFADHLVDYLAETYDISEQRVRAILQSHLDEVAGRSAHGPAPASGDLAADEWLAFHAERQEGDHRDRFVTRHVEFAPSDDAPSHTTELLADLIDQVVIATTLREVRALTGFSRLSPESRIVDPSLGRGLDWLPAIEVFGEGIFLSLREQAVQEWEGQRGVREVARQLETRRTDSLFGPRLKLEATPRFLLLHTFAHLLIRQLAFDCGYAASSLRERVYARESIGDAQPQAGLLIYTAAGDVEGTLGGLARQGEPPRLRDTVLRALERAAWCSSDPLCGESDGQGFGAMNLGACHACTLVSETSCAHFNVVLDRGFVTGSNRVTGFFSQVITAARSAATAETTR